MSLPREILDELLSAHLDGQLSDDERSRVEQMLERDPQLRRQLQKMEQLRGAVGQLSAASDPPRLDARFSERVLRVAAAEAEKAGWQPDHPVRRAAAKLEPDAAPARPLSGPPGGRRAWYRSAGALAALAASLLAIAVLRPGGDPADDSNGQMAGIGAASEKDGSGERVSEADSRSGEALAAEEVAGAEERIAAAAAGQTDRASEDPQERAPAGASEDRIALTPEIPSVPIDPVPIDPSSLSAAESREPRGEERSGDPQSDLDAMGLEALRLVMVLEVRLTEAGVTADALAQAFREAGIQQEDDQRVDSTLVGYLRQGGMIGSEAATAEETSDQGDRVSVMLIEAPATQLDRLMVALFAMDDQVDGVGLQLAADPPILAAIDRLAPEDPNAVRHDDREAIVRRLRGEGTGEATAPQGGALFTAAPNRQFTPLAGDALSMMGALQPAASGPQMMARTLLLVRYPAER